MKKKKGEYGKSCLLGSRQVWPSSAPRASSATHSIHSPSFLIKESIWNQINSNLNDVSHPFLAIPRPLPHHPINFNRGGEILSGEMKTASEEMKTPLTGDENASQEMKTPLGRWKRPFKRWKRLSRDENASCPSCLSMSLDISLDPSIQLTHLNATQCNWGD